LISWINWFKALTLNLREGPAGDLYTLSALFVATGTTEIPRETFIQRSGSAIGARNRDDDDRQFESCSQWGNMIQPKK
jgi:hypothetical protein